MPLFNGPIEGEGIHEPRVDLPAMHLGEEVVEDYVAMRLSLRAHPMGFLRPLIPGMTPHADLSSAARGRITVCGLVVTRQRPSTASGVIVLILEDETGVSNIVVWPKVYQQFRCVVMGGRLLRVTGYLQREGIVVHLISQQITDMSPRLGLLGHPMRSAVGITRPAPRVRHPREQVKRQFPSRNFH